MISRHGLPLVLSLLIFGLAAPTAFAEETSRLATALDLAGENEGELRRALESVASEQRDGMRFLIENMPRRDLESLSAAYLLENVAYAYRAWNESPWQEQIDSALFFNSVLPYASINERRDRWRKDFYEKFKPLVADAKTPGEAAARLNNEVFGLLGVKYSTKRAKADQSPYETIDSGLASCTGLSVVLIDACRAVGVPARFVGTPLWSDRSGNHSWVEVWDGRWRFTGAAEPAGMDLDKGWFVGRAARAVADDPRYAIYATSFRRTPLSFPCIWDARIDYVPAVNVTDRYTADAAALPEGHAAARFRVVDSGTGERTTCALRVYDAAGEALFSGKTKDERFDSNDHLTANLPVGAAYRVVAEQGGTKTETEFRLDASEQLVTLRVDAEAENESGSDAPVGEPLASLRKHLALPRDQRGPIAEQAFATTPLSKEQAVEAAKLLVEDHEALVRETRAEEMEAKVLVDGDLKMPFEYKIFGEKPASGRSLFISMHGGGGAPPELNDRQWRNQQRLYEPEEGVYLAPRAPTDTWNLWHQDHIDRFFARLIENLIVLEEVDPNRVYLMGYSAGGDGAYQLAPRMADRWAAVAMMAGHPNDTSPLGLRNIGFALYMGGRDAAYKRNEIAAEWKEKLAKLAAADEGGYHHLVTIYPEKGHWMDREDASAIAWMASQTRDPLPQKIVWRQDDVTHRRFYWLSTGEGSPQAGTTVIAKHVGQQIDLQTTDVPQLAVRLNDEMLDLNQPIQITAGQRTLYEGTPERTIATLAKTLAERGDPAAVYSAEVPVSLAE